MDQAIRNALAALEAQSECVIPGIGHFSRTVGEDRVLKIPNPITGELGEQVLRGKRKLRHRWAPFLSGVTATQDTKTEAPDDASPVALRVVQSLREHGHVTVSGLGRFVLHVTPPMRGTVRSPFTGELTPYDRPEQRRLRFSPSAAVDAVVKGEPIPEIVAAAEVSYLIEEYPPGAWAHARLLVCLDRNGWRGTPKRELADGCPPAFRAFASEVASGYSRTGPELCEGYRDHLEGIDTDGPEAETEVFEVLRDGNGDRWVCYAGEDPNAFHFDHEMPNQAREHVSLSQLLVAWLFHREVHRVVAGRLLSEADHGALSAHFAALSAVAARNTRSFSPFPF